MFNTIKKRDEISELFKNGNFISFKHFSVIFLPAKNSTIAFVAGKKIGNSVARNRMRRKLKRVFIEHKNWFGGKTSLLVAKRGLIDASDEEIKNNFERITRRNSERCSKKSSGVSD